MKLTKNGFQFLSESINNSAETFDDSDILKHGITNSDLQELMDYDFINYDEDTDQFYWV